MIRQRGATDSFTVPPGLKVLRLQADTAECPLGYMLCRVSCEDETYCVLMAVHHLYGYVRWIYVCLIVMSSLYTRISCPYIPQSIREISNTHFIVYKSKCLTIEHGICSLKWYL